MKIVITAVAVLTRYSTMRMKLLTFVLMMILSTPYNHYVE